MSSTTKHVGPHDDCDNPDLHEHDLSGVIVETEDEGEEDSDDDHPSPEGGAQRGFRAIQSAMDEYHGR